MPNKRDYYNVLGLDRNADAVTIKKAYRKLAHKHHPDRNPHDPEAEEKFKEVGEAYQILSDDQKKSAYDRFGHQASRRSSDWNIQDPIDIFNIFFHNSGPQKGRDIVIQIDLTLEEVSQGVAKSVQYRGKTICNTCQGIGGTGDTCMTCGGYGKVEQVHGFFSQVMTCSSCSGKGMRLKNRCNVCQGLGNTEEKKSSSVRIPSGIPDNALLRVRGAGEKTHLSLPRGDLVCSINVLKHDVFVRRNADLIMKQELSFVQASLGDKIVVPSILGEELELKIPPGTQFGQTFRIKGKGLTYNQKAGMFGDQLVVVHIAVPTDLSDKAKEALKQFSKELQ